MLFWGIVFSCVVDGFFSDCAFLFDFVGFVPNAVHAGDVVYAVLDGWLLPREDINDLMAPRREMSDKCRRRAAA